jgi:hypothetical protein
LNFSNNLALLEQLLVVEMSYLAIGRGRQRLCSALAEPMAQALTAARLQPVAYLDETDAPTGTPTATISLESGDGNGSWSPPWCRTKLLGLQQQLFDYWHNYREGTIDWPALQQSCLPIRQEFETTLQRLVELGA